MPLWQRQAEAQAPVRVDEVSGDMQQGLIEPLIQALREVLEFGVPHNSDFHEKSVAAFRRPFCDVSSPKELQGNCREGSQLVIYFNQVIARIQTLKASNACQNLYTQTRAWLI